VSLPLNAAVTELFTLKKIMVGKAQHSADLPVGDKQTNKAWRTFSCMAYDANQT